ncbi:hypothetical protein LCL89_09285 [Halobacillus yeomjeoni]|uniref:Uncharacterized protein n=1 Tax=Halobacillus yeomjeoni TaxID=311194 RepID=A0A931HWV8_9BACI|nr:hypothetical protein [Halobacillus yeomjeoni]MBH0231322.1 hypothetical protein [Halobacillus yeomjeoni]MCA0984236.1 hypothetical protein [Halobacillus yeomjeoni]
MSESKTKTLSVPLSVWYNESSDSIHMNVDGKLTSVNRKPESKRGNPSLYGILEEHLKNAGKL